MIVIAKKNCANRGGLKFGLECFWKKNEGSAPDDSEVKEVRLTVKSLKGRAGDESLCRGPIEDVCGGMYNLNPKLNREIGAKKDVASHFNKKAIFSFNNHVLMRGTSSRKLTDDPFAMTKRVKIHECNFASTVCSKTTDFGREICRDHGDKFTKLRNGITFTWKKVNPKNQE